MPNGEVGDYATIVRKDRNSDDWYLGSVTDENARTLEVKLDFLEPGAGTRRRSTATATAPTGTATRASASCAKRTRSRRAIR